METNEKPTKFGTISFVLAIAVVVLWCIYLVLFGLMVEGNVTFGMHPETAGYVLLLGGGTVLAILTVLITLAGIIFGFLALRKQDPKRTLAISGLVLNFLCFAPYCLFFMLLVAGSISAADFMPSFAP